MTIQIAQSCVGCGACVPECPEGALELGGSGQVVVDAAKCTDCGSCISVCPVGSLSLPKGSVTPPAPVASAPVKEDKPASQPVPQILPDTPPSDSTLVWVFIEQIDRKSNV